MKEGDSYTIVLTIKGTLTEDLKELLEQDYPDDNFTGAIHRCLVDELGKGRLGALCRESNVSFTNIKNKP